MMTVLPYSFALSMRGLVVPMLLLAIFISEHELLAIQVAQRSNDDVVRVQYHPSPKVRVVPDIVFARYGSKSLRLDLYLPIDSREAVPGVIVIRGGGWLLNDRKESAHVASALAERGVAAASIEYRT